MLRRIPLVAATWLIAALAPLAQAQSDADVRCKTEVASRGFGGYAFERVQVNGNFVTGQMRSGNDVLVFSCLVDNMGNVGDVRVERAAVLPVPPVRNEPIRNEPVRNAPVPNAPVPGEPVRGEPMRVAPAQADSDYKRGFRDGQVRSPYNNYSNSPAYTQGYEDGYRSRSTR